MKSSNITYSRLRAYGLSTLVAAAAGLWSLPGGALAQLYVGTNGSDDSSLTDGIGTYNASTGATTNANFIPSAFVYYPEGGLLLSGNVLYVGNYGGNAAVATHDATTGAVINSTFITGVPYVQGLALLGNTLFVASQSNGASDNTGYIATYDATTGAVLNPSFITAVSNPIALALSGNDLFVSDWVLPQNQPSSYNVGKYNATTGATINASFISGLSGPQDLAVSGNSLFVAENHDTVGEYNATTGAAIDAGFITGLNGSVGLAVSGDDLFVTELDAGTVGRFNFSAATYNPNFITGLNNPVSLAIALPEPTTAASFAVGLVSLAAFHRRRNRQSRA